MTLPKYFYPQSAMGGKLEDVAPFMEDDNYIAQEKFDGHRALIHKAGGKVRIYSKTTSKKTGLPVENQDRLPYLVAACKNLPNGTVLDGELCIAISSHSRLVSRVLGANPDKARELQDEEGHVVFYCFDILACDNKDLTGLTWTKRYEILSSLSSLRITSASQILPVKPVVGTKAIKKYLESIWASGKEGIILKHKDSIYHQGKRDKSWLKIKKERTFDVVFMGIFPAKEMSVKKGDKIATPTRIAGKAGAIIYGQMVDGKLKDLGIVAGYDDVFRDEITKNWKKCVGKVFEVTAQEQFASGKFRHGRFKQWRPDKVKEDCLFRPDTES